MSPPPPDLSVAVALSATASVRSKVLSFPFCLGSRIQFVTACICMILGLLALGALGVALGLSEIAFMLTANDMVTESWIEWFDPCEWSIVGCWGCAAAGHSEQYVVQTLHSTDLR